MSDPAPMTVDRDSGPESVTAGSLHRMVMCVLVGGPMLKISVNKKIIEFEMHPYCGPHILDRKGKPLKHQPRDFLHAVSQWAQQGNRMEDGLCRWDHKRKPILKHLGGRHWQWLGEEPAVQGG